MLNYMDMMERVIHPTNNYMEMGGKAPDVLMLGTGLTETDLHHLDQIQGPALGLYQMEPFTHDDLWNTYLSKPSKQDILEKIAALESKAGHFPNRHQELVGNMFYSTAMARLRYWRVADPLPEWDDPLGMALYWKNHYNTVKGKGKINKAMEDFNEAITVVRKFYNQQKGD